MKWGKRYFLCCFYLMPNPWMLSRACVSRVMTEEMATQSEFGIEVVLRSGYRGSAMVAAVRLSRWRRLVRRISASTGGSAPAPSVAIAAPVSASAGRHATLTAWHLLIARTHPGTSVSTLWLVPIWAATRTWAWASHWRMMGRRVSGHGTGTARVRSTLRGHRGWAAVLGEAVGRRSLRRVSRGLRLLRRIPVKLASRRTIFTPLP